MSQQCLPTEGVWIILALAKDDIPANRVSVGRNGLRGAGGLQVCMDMDIPEILAEVSFHPGARPVRQGLADWIRSRTDRIRAAGGVKVNPHRPAVSDGSGSGLGFLLERIAGLADRQAGLDASPAQQALDGEIPGRG
jgi:hypothetical protein